MTEKKLTKKEKALICATFVGAGIAGYFGIKYFKQKAHVSKLEHRVTVLETVVSEDVLEDAIATVTRKLDYRNDKIKVFENRTDSESIKKLEEHKQFAELFKTRLEDYNELKRLRYIEK